MLQGPDTTQPQIPWEENAPEVDESANGLSQPAGPVNHKPMATPLPKLQLFLLLWIQLAEPIVATVILPFINDLIISLDITGGDDRATGHYVGLIESTFFIFETLTILHWGRLSDKIGRRPVLMIGTTGLTLSIFLFGLSRTFPMLVFSRALCGVLNGNVGVVKAMMSEITDVTNFDQAISFLPVVWATGNSMGPLIGGSLAKPHERFPGIFHGSFWHAHPYFLSCFAAAVFPFSALCLSGLFLKETAVNALRKTQGKLHYAPVAQQPDHPFNDDEDTAAESEPEQRSPAGASWPSLDETLKAEPEPSLRDLLTFRILAAMLNYGCLAFVDISYVALLAVFLASKPTAGGIGLSPPVIGVILGIQGIINGVFQVTCFKHIKRRLGSKLLFQLGMSCFFVIFTAFPVLHRLMSARSTEGGLYAFTPTIWAVLILQQSCAIMSSMCYSCIFVFICSAAPSPSAMGSTNGLAQTVSSFTRAIGPASITSLFAESIKHDILGGRLVYLVLILLTLLSMIATCLLPRGDQHLAIHQAAAQDEDNSN